MVMEYGKQIMIKFNHIKVTMRWIRSQDMAFIHGKMVGLIKETLKMILEMDMDSFMMVIRN